MEKRRILRIDGIKGLACVLVFTHHFMLYFFNASYYGSEMPSMTKSGFDTKLAQAPYGVLVNGNFWVCVFLVISAFLLSSKTFHLMREEEEGKPMVKKLGTMLLKRYPRLLIPTAFAAIANFWIGKGLDYLHFNYPKPEVVLNFNGLLEHTFLLMWITTDPYVIGPFWMLHILLFGSYLAVLLSLLSGRKKNRIFFVYLLLLYVFGRINHYYTAAVFGVILGWLQVRCDKETLPFYEKFQTWKVWIGAACLLFGLWFGGYPSYVVPENMYSSLAFFVNRIPSGGYELIHCFGAFLLLAGILLLDKSEKVLGGKGFTLLGKLSFSIYILHDVLLTYFAKGLMRGLESYIPWYVTRAGVVYLILLTLLLLVSAGFTATIEKWSGKVLHKILE